MTLSGLTAPNVTLVLVRHGETTWIAEGRFQGRQDAPLSPLGQRQAALVAARLAERDAQTPLPIPAGPPAAVWHSPLSRAAATARAIAAAQSTPVPLRATERLTEIAQGEWEGLPHHEVRTRFANELAAWRRQPASSHAPGGEALAAASTRVRAAMDDIVARVSRAADSSAAPEEHDALASLRHDPVPGYPASDGSTSPPREPWAIVVAHDGIFRLALMGLLDVPIERFWSFPFNLCAITVIAINDGVATLRAHNLAEHLAPIADEARAAAEARGDRRGAL